MTPQKEFRADLHTHSTASDGTLDPLDLIQLAKDSGLNGMSITDHDTVNAYQQLLPMLKDRSFLLLPGVEFSAVHHDHNIHLLGYSFCLSSPQMVRFCEQHLAARHERMMQMIDLLVAHGMISSEEELEQIEQKIRRKESVGRPHVAAVLLRKGIVSSIQEAFERFLGKGKPCYVPMRHFSVEETLQVIHDAQGIAVLAHPHLIKSPSMIRQLAKFPFDGIEAHYAQFRREQCEMWLALAQTRGWLVTGGSDFHGTIKPQIPIGASWTSQTTCNFLYEHSRVANQALLEPLS